jgi:uncharacterized DUF497 family protein
MLALCVLLAGQASAVSLVCFIERGLLVRIISARRATGRERQDHEEGTQS